jgi:hypothetical protein
MSCRQAFDIDLPAFLANAEKPEWAAFREHYPRCPTCAGEVRAWTELHHLLLAPDDAHPAAEVLAHLSEEPAALAMVEREAVERHLAGCRMCRDEVTALRRFNPGALERVAAAPPVQRARRLAALTGLVGRVVLHPAFAYALVLALLYPAIGQHLMTRRPEARPPGTPGLLAKFPRQLALKLPAVPATKPASPPETKTASGSGSASAPAAEAKPPSVPDLGRLKNALSKDRMVRVGAPTAERAQPALMLGDGTRPHVGAGGVSTGLVLRLPLPAGEHSAGELQVRVVDDGERHEIRERFSDSSGGRLDVHVPAGWLAPGSYRAELYAGAARTPTHVFHFEVGGD